MAVQSPPIPPKSVSPLKISPTPGKTSPMATIPKPSVPTTLPSSTPVVPSTSGAPTTPQTMLNQPEPKKRKWLWVLLGIFGAIVLVAIVVGLYLGLS